MNLTRENDVKYGKMTKWVLQAVVYLKMDIYVILSKNGHILK